MSITFRPLASSSAGNAYLLSAGPAVAPLLLDCGIPFKELQIALDFKVSSLAGCLITHAHGDHCKAAEKLLSFGVGCYATDEAWENIEGSCVHNATSIHPDKVERIGAWTVKPFKCVHDAEGTVGYFISYGENRIVYMTDTAYSRYSFEGLTHLYIECNHSAEIMRSHVRGGDLHADRYRRTRQNHMSLETLLSFLDEIDRSKLKEVVLLHLSDGNSDEKAFKEAVQKKCGCPVYVAGAKGGLA